MRSLVALLVVLCCVGSAYACVTGITTSAPGVRSIVAQVTHNSCPASTPILVILYNDMNWTSQEIPYATATALNQTISATGTGTTTFTFNDINAGRFWAVASAQGTRVGATAQQVSQCYFDSPPAASQPTLVLNGGNSGTRVVSGNNLFVEVTEHLGFAAVKYEWMGNGNAVTGVCGTTYTQDATSGNAATTGSWTRGFKSATGCSTTSVYQVTNLNTALGPCTWRRNESFVNNTIQQYSETAFYNSLRITTRRQGPFFRGVLRWIEEESFIVIGLSWGTTVQADTANQQITGTVVQASTVVKTVFTPEDEKFYLYLLTSVQAPYQLMLPASSTSVTVTNEILTDGSKGEISAAITAATPAHSTFFQTTAITAPDSAQRAACLDTTGSTYSDVNYGSLELVRVPCTQFWYVAATTDPCSTTPVNTASGNGPNRTMTGNWSVVYNVTCDPTSQGACASPNISQITINWYTASDNYCLRVFASDSATATLRVFDSVATRDNYTPENRQFVFGTISYFRARIQSTSATTMFWAKAERISIVSGYAQQTGTTGVQVLYNTTFNGAPWWVGSQATPSTAAQTAQFQLTETINRTNGSPQLDVDFQWRWGPSISAAYGDSKTDTVVRYDGRVRFIQFGGGLEMPMSARVGGPDMHLMADPSAGSSVTVQVAELPAGPSVPGTDAAGSTSTSTIAVAAAVAGVALIAAGAVATTIKRSRETQQRKSNHMASVDLAIPNMPSSSSAKLDV